MVSPPSATGSARCAPRCWRGDPHQTTPTYAEYKWKYLTPQGEILAQFDAKRRAVLEALFAAAAPGRVWARVDLAEAAARLGEPRERPIRALDHLEEKGHIELVATGVRQRVSILRRPEDAGRLADELTARFEALEEREVARLADVVDFIEGASCHWKRLAAHFGERLAGPCGHCTFCRTGAPVRLAPSSVPGRLPAPAQIAALRRQHPEALAEPRAVARLLCGLSSPGLTRAKLTRNPLFGTLADADFRAVLASIAGGRDGHADVPRG